MFQLLLLLLLLLLLSLSLSLPLIFHARCINEREVSVNSHYHNLRSYKTVGKINNDLQADTPLNGGRTN